MVIASTEAQQVNKVMHYAPIRTFLRLPENRKSKNN